jgi:2-succinyl-5-enolpyruvyl-6-hydroxy-3-cyclohexene-1-carboxylate synthase
VHLNLAFTEPLLGESGPLPEGRSDGAPWHAGAFAKPGYTVVGELDGRHGVLVAGRGCDPTEVRMFAELSGWPVLADPLSGCRGADPWSISGFDLLARSTAWAESHRPDAVVRMGAPPASKALSRWLTDVELYVVVDPKGAPADPDRTASHLVADSLAPPPTAAPAEWLAAWRTADDVVQAVLDAALGEVLDDPGVARTVLGALPPNADLVVASSMPVRDVEWFGGTTEGRVLANRGANGIDGVLSTAVGVAMGGRPTVALVGDLAFLHDTNALLGAVDRDVSLTVVVVDNDGGAIFSFLPQAEQLPGDEFERLFGTPHGLDLVEVARAHGVDAFAVTSLDELAATVAQPAPGIGVRVIRTDRQANVAVHQRLYTAVADALADR